MNKTELTRNRDGVWLSVEGQANIRRLSEFFSKKIRKIQKKRGRAEKNIRTYRYLLSRIPEPYCSMVSHSKEYGDDPLYYYFDDLRERWDGALRQAENQKGGAERKFDQIFTLQMELGNLQREIARALNPPETIEK